MPQRPREESISEKKAESVELLTAEKRSEVKPEESLATWKSSVTWASIVLVKIRSCKIRMGWVSVAFSVRGKRRRKEIVVDWIREQFFCLETLEYFKKRMRRIQPFERVSVYKSRHIRYVSVLKSGRGWVPNTGEGERTPPVKWRGRENRAGCHEA